MRVFACLILLTLAGTLFSRTIPTNNVDPWKAHFGLMAGMNVSMMKIKGGYGPTETSTTQWTAALGLYYKSNVKNLFRLELQTGYEICGAGREHYYDRDGTNFIRIFDRYHTIPLTLLLTRNFGWKETISLGAGFKSSFVISHSVRHPAQFNTAGIILTPDVLSWYGSPVAQLGINFQFAEVAICGWYAVTPLIDQFDVKAAPYGVTFLVKARLFEM